MPLDETCELLFQMHKQGENYQVVWTKSTYIDKPADLDVAKELLLTKNIIYTREGASTSDITILNPRFHEAKSFQQAISVVTQQSQISGTSPASLKNRQLAVILFADIEGYTRIMQRDETLAVTLRKKFKQTIDDQIALHQGRLHQWTGDGALCSFTSSVEGVHAAIEIQKQMRIAPVVPLRIGVHGGDVIMRENEVYGDGVNIASRIESFAIPGSVLISKKIFDDVKNQRDIQTIRLGKFRFKNVREAMEIFAISNTGVIVPSRNELEGKGSVVSAKKRWLLFGSLLLLLALSVWIGSRFFDNTAPSYPSIAVLPFVDMSPAKDHEYFGDGLSEELLNHLAKIPNLKVIARTSSFSFKGKNEDLRSIGEKLGVSSILEGSVRKSGNKIRITAQLINAKDGSHIWSETYERPFNDIFKIQDEISIAVVQRLKSALLKNTSFHEYAGNPEAYNLMLQARFLTGLGNEDSTHKAIGLYKEALAIDSGAALVWASLSQAYALLSGSDHLGKAEGIIKAKQAVEKALSLDPHLPEAYIARGRIRQLYDWDWKGADADYQKAFDLNPNNAVILHRKASLARTLGNVDTAILLYQKAIELDPLSAVTYNSFSITLMNANRLDEAIQKSRRILQMKPQFAGCHAFISGIYLLQGKKDSAYIELQRETDEEWKMAALAMMYNIPGRKEEANTALKTLMMTEYQDDWAYQIAQAFAWNGNTDQAFFWLERAYVNRDGGLAEIKGNPFFRNIRNDPRYLSFMKKMGLIY